MLSRILAAKPYIIAEVGSNWDEFGDLIHSISMAAKCGANAVKFQRLSDMDMYGVEDPASNLAIFPDEWLPQLKEKADACGIDFMCSAFSVEGFKAVDPFVTAHKIASCDFNNLPLVRFVAKLGKPIVLSCGGQCLSDIRAVTSELKSRNVEFVLLYCNSSYPSVEHDLFEIGRLREFSQYIGFSDHSIDVINAPKIAYRVFDAVLIEKHFSLDHIEESADYDHSITQDQFKRMVDAVRGPEFPASFGTGEEDVFRVRDTRKAKAVVNIKVGERLKHRVNYEFFRSTSFSAALVGGFSPMLVDKVENVQVKVALKAGEPIKLGDLAF